MFWKREKSKVLSIIQQNDKYTQEYQRTIWNRSLKTTAPMGKECFDSQQLQESLDVYFKVH